MTKSNEDSDKRAIIIKADHSLKNRIRVSIKSLFTANRVQSAQLMLDSGRDELQKRCIDDLERMKNLAVDIDLTADNALILAAMQKISLQIKGTSGMVGFPIASDMADSLYCLLSNVKSANVSPALVHIVQSHVSAINAIFVERRAGFHDPLGRKVLRELEDLVSAFVKVGRI